MVLEDATQELNEVVVTALGIKRSEKALSYNVQQLSGDELTTVKDANFISSLNGKVAGVNINSSNTTGRCFACRDAWCQSITLPIWRLC